MTFTFDVDYSLSRGVLYFQSSFLDSCVRQAGRQAGRHTNNQTDSKTHRLAE